MWVNSKTRYLNANGEFIGDAYDYGYDFSNGLALVSLNNKFMFIDQKGKTAIDGTNKFLYAKSFSNGLAAVMGMKGKWGYINSKGETVIRDQFDNAFQFDSKLAPVRIGNKFGFIDRTGKLVFPAVYEWAAEFENGFATVWKDDKYGYITSKGEYKTAIAANTSLEFYDNVVVMKVLDPKDDRYFWGYMDQSGQWLVRPQQFDVAHPFYNGVGTVYKDGVKGTVSKTGVITWE